MCVLCVCVCVCMCVCVCLYAYCTQSTLTPTKTSLPPAPTSSALHCHIGHRELRRLHVFDARTTRAWSHARSSPPPSSMNNSASASFHPPSLLLSSTLRPPLAPVFQGLILTPRSFLVFVAHTISWSREGKMLRCITSFIATLMLVRVRAMGVCERRRVRVCAGKGVRERAATRSRPCTGHATAYMKSAASQQGPERRLLHKVQGRPSTHLAVDVISSRRHGLEPEHEAELQQQVPRQRARKEIEGEEEAREQERQLGILCEGRIHQHFQLHIPPMYMCHERERMKNSTRQRLVRSYFPLRT